MCAGYLEIHVAEEILKALDIGQYDVIVIGLTGNKTAGNAGNLFLDRHACCHECHAGCADAGL